MPIQLVKGRLLELGYYLTDASKHRVLQFVLNLAREDLERWTGELIDIGTRCLHPVQLNNIYSYLFKPSFQWRPADMTCGQDALACLPGGIVQQILRFLPLNSLIAASKTCLRLNLLCSEEALWEAKFARVRPGAAKVDMLLSWREHCHCVYGRPELAGRPVARYGGAHVQMPGGVAFKPNGNILFADVATNSVKELDSIGTLLNSFGSFGDGDGEFDFPLAIACASDGRIFVLDSGLARVQAFDADGKFLFKFGDKGPAARSPTGIAVSGPHLAVADASSNRVLVYSTHDGRYLKQLSLRYKNKGGFLSLVSVAGGPELIIVADDSGRIQVFDWANEFLNDFEHDGIRQQPPAIAVDSRGRLAVAHTHTNDVSLFDTNGQHLGTFGHAHLQGIARGLAFDSLNRLLVADAAGSCLLLFE
eukprot:TRINITY_DN72_c0_g2_i1.p1 TRINITY_DN72_c0_g2~~TRINITY_DN72_c0_g2_i1.p1  ORF type:complete len:420 (+),score=160.20 TRINITY_DN72_c0_g2_i1:1537-2796(+)